MKDAIFLIFFSLAACAMLAVLVSPYIAGGAIFRLIFRSAHPGLVALFAAVLLLVVADILFPSPFLPTFRSVCDLNAKLLSDVAISNTFAATCCTASTLVGGFLGTVAIPFLFAYAGVRLVDRYQGKRGPSQASHATSEPAPDAASSAREG